MCSYYSNKLQQLLLLGSHLDFLAVWVGSWSWKNLLGTLAYALEYEGKWTLSHAIILGSHLMSQESLLLMEKVERTGGSCPAWCMDRLKHKEIIKFLPRVESAAHSASNKSCQKAMMKSKEDAGFGRRSPILFFCHCSHHILLLTDTNTSPSRRGGA